MGCYISLRIVSNDYITYGIWSNITLKLEYFYPIYRIIEYTTSIFFQF